MEQVIHPSVLPPSYNDACPSFTIFSALPSELRAKVWEQALKPRIVRWTRNGEPSNFKGPPRSLALMLVSQEAREAAFMYGGYKDFSEEEAEKPIYFSPKLDYLWFDPGWVEPLQLHLPATDSFKSLLCQLGEVQSIMVHPNWSGRRRTPTVPFGNVPSIRTVLVAADEKSIGLHGSVMLETVKEVQSYYSGLMKTNVAEAMPYVAVGCVGWVGEERRKMHHGTEDSRQLVRVFEKQWEMNGHLRFLREEEWMFTHRHLERPRIVHKLRFVGGGAEETKTISESSGGA